MISVVVTSEAKWYCTQLVECDRSFMIVWHLTLYMEEDKKFENLLLENFFCLLEDQCTGSKLMTAAWRLFMYVSSFGELLARLVNH